MRIHSQPLSFPKGRKGWMILLPHHMLYSWTKQIRWLTSWIWQLSKSDSHIQYPNLMSYLKPTPLSWLQTAIEMLAKRLWVSRKRLGDTHARSMRLTSSCLKGACKELVSCNCIQNFSICTQCTYRYSSICLLLDNTTNEKGKQANWTTMLASLNTYIYTCQVNGLQGTENYCSSWPNNHEGNITIWCRDTWIIDLQT